MNFKKIIIAMLMSIMAFGMGWGQLPSSFPPKSYPSSILVVTDPGVKQYWDVKRIMYLGPGNGGHKFRVYGTANADHRAASVDMHYIRHDDKLQSAGAYYFPEVKKGDSFNFDIVSAYPGHAPSSFLGFMIKDDLYPVREEDTTAYSTGQSAREQAGGYKNENEIRSGSNDNAVYEDVEVAAVFPGGIPALMQWLSSNVRYPESAQKKGIQGKVKVNFIVEKNGMISNAKVLVSVDSDLDKEAMRVVNKMPKWEPAKKNGAPVRSYYTLPINFRLQSIK